jgi:hypothetical protein
MELSQQTISVKKLVLKKLVTPSMMALLLIGLFSLLSLGFQMEWIGDPFQNDVNQYYSYLVAQFIHHDFSFHFPHQYWLIESPIGDMIPKVTMGMAMMYFPFFVLGNNIAFAYGYDPLGYSAPFAWCVHIGTLIYVFIGFWYMRKTLLLFFSEWVSAITMVLMLFATNLFYYTFREGEMAHSYLFFFFSLFFYHAIKWHVTKNFKYLCYMSFIAGFVALIRPTEILILVIPLLYQVNSIAALTIKINELLTLRWKLLIVGILFLLPLIPQFLFWKSFAGQYLFFSYGSNERFFFGDPKIYSVLFGWHKGWFVYTPLALLMVAGLVMMWFRWKRMALPLTVYLLFNIYIVSSWWDWGFGGAYGMRALVQTFAFMAVPLAFFIKWTFSVTTLKRRIPLLTVSFAAYLFCIALNFIQMSQIRNSMFHWDSMTKEAYWFTFMKTHYTEADREHLKTLLKKPDYKAMRKGDRDER